MRASRPARPAPAPLPAGPGIARGGDRARGASRRLAAATGAGARRALRGEPGDAPARARRAGARWASSHVRHAGGSWRVRGHRRAAERAHELLGDGGLARPHAGRARARASRARRRRSTRPRRSASRRARRCSSWSGCGPWTACRSSSTARASRCRSRPGSIEVDLDEASLYEVLEERYGIRPTRARFTVEAIAADERRAALLGLEPGQPAAAVPAADRRRARPARSSCARWSTGATATGSARRSCAECERVGGPQIQVVEDADELGRVGPTSSTDAIAATPAAWVVVATGRTPDGAVRRARVATSRRASFDPVRDHGRSARRVPRAEARRPAFPVRVDAPELLGAARRGGRIA